MTVPHTEAGRMTRRRSPHSPRARAARPLALALAPMMASRPGRGTSSVESGPVVGSPGTDYSGLALGVQDFTHEVLGVEFGLAGGPETWVAGHAVDDAAGHRQ